RHPVVLIDKEDRVIGVLAGRPKDTVGWGRAIHEVERAMRTAREEGVFHDKVNRRGTTKFLNCGVSYGGGQTEPRNISQGRNERVVNELLRNPAVDRVAGFMSNAFKMFNPGMHALYSSTMAMLCAHDDNVRPNFSKNVFGAATFNLGPQVATLVHTDHLNYAPGWCAILALGNFDPTRGGHLVLWDLKLIVEFPPGSLIMIPSAILRHSNTPVQEGEERMSFTQFSAGGLFRWVECKFRTQKQFLADGGVFQRNGKQRWLNGINAYSTWTQLKARARRS
ncbi:hypothetical protein OH76DRAFT_1363083, partial [Lentinus brumalis]